MIVTCALYVFHLFQHWLEHLFDDWHIVYPWSVNLFLTCDWIYLNTIDTVPYKVPYCCLGNSYGDTTSLFRSYEWMFKSLLANQSAVPFPSVALWPGTHISCTLLCFVSCMRDCWQSQTSFEVIRWLLEAVIELGILRECKCFYSCSCCVDSQPHMPWWHTLLPEILWSTASYHNHTPQLQCLYFY
jgi:hypothetical protein